MNFRLIDSLDALEIHHSKANGVGSIAGSVQGDSSSVGSPETGGGANDKLRESLLRTSREHYRHMKQIEVLEASVDTLKIALKKSEASNRHLKVSLEELQASQAEEEGFLPPAPPAHGTSAAASSIAQSGAIVNTARSAHSNAGTAGSNTGSSSVSSHAPIKSTGGGSTDNKEKPDRMFGHLDELFQVSMFFDSAIIKLLILECVFSL